MDRGRGANVALLRRRRQQAVRAGQPLHEAVAQLPPVGRLQPLRPGQQLRGCQLIGFVGKGPLPVIVAQAERLALLQPRQEGGVVRRLADVYVVQACGLLAGGRSNDPAQSLYALPGHRAATQHDAKACLGHVNALVEAAAADQHRHLARAKALQVPRPRRRAHAGMIDAHAFSPAAAQRGDGLLRLGDALAEHQDSLPLLQPRQQVHAAAYPGFRQHADLLAPVQQQHVRRRRFLRVHARVPGQPAYGPKPGFRAHRLQEGKQLQQLFQQPVQAFSERPIVIILRCAEGRGHLAHRKGRQHPVRDGVVDVVAVDLFPQRPPQYPVALPAEGRRRQAQARVQATREHLGRYKVEHAPVLRALAVVALVADQQDRVAQGKGAAHVRGQGIASGVDDVYHHAAVAPVPPSAAIQTRPPGLRRRAVDQRRQPLAGQRDGGHHHPDLQVWMALAKRLDRGQGEARLPRARGHMQDAPAAIVLPGLQALPLPAIQLHGTALLTAFVINISNKPRTGKVLLEIFVICIYTVFIRQQNRQRGIEA